MRQRLPRLHHAHDGRVDLILPVLEHALVRRVVVLLRLLHLYRVHLYPRQPLVEVVVDGEDVSVVDILALRGFAQHALVRFPARERLQRPPQLLVFDPGRVLELLERHRLRVVEEHENHRLKQRHRELFNAALWKLRAKQDVPERVLPHQPAPAVLAEVILAEHALEVVELARELHLARGVRRPVPRGEDVDEHVDVFGEFFRDLFIRREPAHDVSRRLHVFEHPLELRRELRPALRLQTADHALLRVHGGALREQKTLREVLLVERLEHVLALDVPEQREHRV
mmetsp:Transcript_14135/g.50791  ORF Transcript_14135/g.50791 Transcript_14135/m.50791 type:complete len:284 (-) Transcript_14135:810-1661(-)